MDEQHYREDQSELLALIVGLVLVATKIAMAAKHRAMPI
jgi:hypothetical protein